jgi:glycosyltransferase involved in cell wall biosynthesis
MEQVPIYMKEASVVVFPYRAIYQSGVLQVAYVFGRPVVATAVGGLPDVVEDGGTGYLVPPDNPGALADGIVRVLADPGQAEAMGQHALELAQNRFAWPTLACQTMIVYRGLAK